MSCLCVFCNCTQCLLNTKEQTPQISKLKRTTINWKPIRSGFRQANVRFTENFPRAFRDLDLDSRLAQESRALASKDLLTNSSKRELGWYDISFADQVKEFQRTKILFYHKYGNIRELKYSYVIIILRI